MPINKQAIEHFERVGRAIAEAHVPDPRPKDFREMLERMFAINPNCGRGTKDPLGGDLPSHLAYLEFRETWLKNREKTNETD